MNTVLQEILAQEEELTRAARMLDVGTLDQLYADDVVVTGCWTEPVRSRPSSTN